MCRHVPKHNCTEPIYAEETSAITCCSPSCFHTSSGCAVSLEGVINDWGAQALLRNGRLRFDQIVGAAAAALGRPKEDARGDVAATFVALLRERYLERTPPCGLPPRPCTLHTKVLPPSVHHHPALFCVNRAPCNRE